jgi:hypothetical protein
MSDYFKPTSPGGSNGDVQFKSAGAFGGFTGFDIVSNVLHSGLFTGSEGAVFVAGDYGSVALRHESGRLYIQNRNGTGNYGSIGGDGSSNITFNLGGTTIFSLPATGDRLKIASGMILQIGNASSPGTLICDKIIQFMDSVGNVLDIPCFVH